MIWCWWCVFFFKQKTGYEMLISDWSSDVCSSDLIAFDAELDAIPDDYLALHASAYLGAAGANYWSDEHGIGTIREIDWTLAREVLAEDDVYYGSSRMVELLIGRYDHDFAHSMSGKWLPSRKIGRAHV